MTRAHGVSHVCFALLISLFFDLNSSISGKPSPTPRFNLSAIILWIVTTCVNTHL